jgi:small subunit ribosomal protein S17
MRDRGLQKSRIGFVVKDKMDKSVIVEIARTVKHPLYGKYVRKRNRFMAHDEKNECKVGDKVRIAEIRPLSKRKRWRVRERLT